METEQSLVGNQEDTLQQWRSQGCIFGGEDKQGGPERG